MRFLFPIIIISLCFPLSLSSEGGINLVPQYTTHEITMRSGTTYKNPYTDVEVWANFVNSKNDTLKRPAFWDGGDTWKVRFAPTDVNRSLVVDVSLQ